MHEEIEYLKRLLPDHYSFRETYLGVNCKSSMGIDDEERWGYTLLAIKAKFGKRFTEIMHHAGASYKSFTVYIRD